MTTRPSSLIAATALIAVQGIASAYDWRYGDRTYQTELPYDPGRSVPIRVDVVLLRN